MRLTAAERRFALTSFAVKAAIFWIAQLVICMLDPQRLVCGFVEKGFLPCLISFAVMDFLVIPQLRRRWDR
jgi:hypothetical protein